MTPKKPRSQFDLDGLPTTDHMDRLCAAFETIADEVKAIRTELQFLGERFDRLADDIDWGLNNEAFKPQVLQSPPPLTSMPVDPLAEDFGERINQYSAKDLEVPTLDASCGTTPQQRDLFS